MIWVLQRHPLHTKRLEGTSWKATHIPHIEAAHPKGWGRRRLVKLSLKNIIHHESKVYFSFFAHGNIMGVYRHERQLMNDVAAGTKTTVFLSRGFS